MKPSTVEIRIDTVVLEGVAFARGVDLAAALRSALAAALQQPANAALLDALRDRDQLDGGTLCVSRTDSGALGEAIAAAVISAAAR